MKIGIHHKSSIAIVVVGYNRINSIKRLFSSLLKSHYRLENVPLYISIDCSEDKLLYDYVEKFHWPYGDKFLNIQKERLGLKNHILKCGNLTKYFKAVIILEDDIYVSPYFYDYALESLNQYYNEDRIAGISLFRDEMNGRLPIIHMNDGSDAFLSQRVSSWGEMWSDKMWDKFFKWYEKNKDSDLSHIDMPEYIKSWKKAWSKFYYAYMIESNKFYLYPSVSLTTCFSDAGENSSMGSCLGQVNLLSGFKEYNFRSFQEMVKYDVYTSNYQIYEWLGLSQKELCIDLLGQNPNKDSKRYLLTPFLKSYKVVRSFGMQLRPMELNIRDNILGNEIFLYDTYVHTNNKEIKETPLTIPYYYLRLFDSNILRRYLNYYFPTDISYRIKNKIKKFFNNVQSK